MKTIITSNWRALCRALCTLLLFSAALWATPRNARAQTPIPTTSTITDFLSSSGDFNADGKQDILWRNIQTGEVRIWYMNGSSILSNDGVATVGLDWQIMGIGDFDGSGFSDILWENANNGSFAIWTMREDSAVSHQYSSPGYQWSITGVGDLEHSLVERDYRPAGDQDIERINICA